MYVLASFTLVTPSPSDLSLQVDQETLARESYALRFAAFKSPHIFDRIAEELNNGRQYYGIDIEKVVATVTDNGMSD